MVLLARRRRCLATEFEFEFETIFEFEFAVPKFEIQ